ncbi:interleukin-4 receptor subunit alpha isoform X2 [Arvicanthis niloticus]|uniref:interleukin-4 receptor subunit alpha isoform X1 n=2 Tax=Arvicanthis niloticus TaxID=61156 RepID=UPI0014868F5E|nr:interleukin-4 receptor subunit alpha isoform X1 [Arvicanthis niloticus]
MGWLCTKFLASVSCLILLWVAGSGSIKVLGEPTCFSDYIRTATCEWPLDSTVNCSSQLRLDYRLDFLFPVNLTCIPKNSASTMCVCHMDIDEPVQEDTYQMELWAEQRQLWHGSFRPSNNVKPPAPGNLTLHTNVSDAWLLTWSNPYPPNIFLHKDLFYMVNISREDNPAEFIVYNVTYMDPRLSFPINILKSGMHYRARVRVMVQYFHSTWSEWSPSITWYNHFQPPLVQRLPLGVSISCLCILLFCLSCYFGIIKIKKIWWDQIPTPARSPLVAIIIQDTQVPLWEKQTRSQESTKCPHWKTCLSKLLPCLLEHRVKETESPKATQTKPLQSPGKAGWCPVEVSRTVLWPENVSVSVVRYMEMFEAPVQSVEEEEDEMVKGDLSMSPENSGGGFQESQADIMARLTENLFSDLLEAENGGIDQSGLAESGSPLPSENGQASMSRACFPMGPNEPTCQITGQPSHPGPPSGSPAQSATNLACTQVPLVLADNPAYRSFSDFSSSAPNPGELASELPQAGHPEEGDPPSPVDPHSSGPSMQQVESWEQILHMSVLQHGTAGSTPAPTSGYQEFLQAVKQGAAQDPGVPGVRPSGDTGYKAFSSLLSSNGVCTDTTTAETDSGHGGYKPFQNPIPNQSPSSMPLFTFGLDMELPPSPLNSAPPNSTPECLGLELGLKGGDWLKAPPPADQVPKPFGDDLGLGIVYSSLTCHLCGRLKQHHSQEESGQSHIVASPGCGCYDDRSPSLGSLLGALESCPGEMPPEANLTSAPKTSSNLSGEGKGPGHSPVPSQTTEVPVGTLGVAVS